MKWSFVIDGQPPSVNHSYSQVVVIKNGKPFRTVAKDKNVEAYQVVASLQTKLARPSGWLPTPGQQIRVNLDFVLTRDLDCDNAMKAILDAIALALGVNDRVFLPCARSKTVNKKEVARTMVEIDDGAP